MIEARSTFTTASGRKITYHRLAALEADADVRVAALPFTIRILLENLLRHLGDGLVTEEEVLRLARRRPGGEPQEIPFMPGRVLLQDFTGVPAVVDLAAMRSATERLGGDPARINPVVPADLVIDHSVQVDRYGSPDAFACNVTLEYERNRERYMLLKWAQRAFDRFRVVPPGTGICHQINVEHLASVVRLVEDGGIDRRVAFPDTVVGTDSHTTMVNGLGVLGWGVGGIEAEAVMLGQPYYMLVPEVIGMRLTGRLPEGTTATDLVLTITERLREKGVVGKFVEFFGPGLAYLSLPDRTTIANMAPEYGATAGFFPIDGATLEYLRTTGRGEELVELVERYARLQGLFYLPDDAPPAYAEVLEFDMGRVEPCVAGPRRPQDRIPLGRLGERFREDLAGIRKKEGSPPSGDGEAGDGGPTLPDGSVAVAAITSCTNTSNPTVMVGAGLLARKAVERGLKVPSHVKTSLAPGSQVVIDYLRASELLRPLEALGFHLVGYGCTTCIGNSGPLPPEIEATVRERNLVAAAVLSGNRNFEARIHPLVKMNYLASPLLVVAFALAGRVDVDLAGEPLGREPEGRPVYLRDLWPSRAEIEETVRRAVRPEMFPARYEGVDRGDERWEDLPVPEGEIYRWDPASTHIQEPPFFSGMERDPTPPGPILEARVLVMLGDSVTTDHISPAGSIPAESPAGRYLLERGVPPEAFNSYGSRRGNHHVMLRGTFANIRLRNLLVPGREGSWTLHHPTGEILSIYEAASRYREEGTPLIILAGREYGTGSSRDWAAKGTALLGVRAVIAESFERIHRSNLVGMGVLPLQFLPGENAGIIGLTGKERFSIPASGEDLRPGQRLEVTALSEQGTETVFSVILRLDSPVEITYYRNGGILQTVLRGLLDRGPG